MDKLSMHPPHMHATTRLPGFQTPPFFRHTLQKRLKMQHQTLRSYWLTGGGPLELAKEQAAVPCWCRTSPSTFPREMFFPSPSALDFVAR